MPVTFHTAKDNAQLSIFLLFVFFFYFSNVIHLFPPSIGPVAIKSCIRRNVLRRQTVYWKVTCIAPRPTNTNSRNVLPTPTNSRRHLI